MAKIKLDKIIFTDTRTDFYVDAKTEKVYMRPHTAFDSEKNLGDIKFYSFGGAILVAPITKILSENFDDFSIFTSVLIFLFVFCLGLIFSYFIESYTLRKQTEHKHFIEIRRTQILYIALRAIQKSSGRWTTTLCFIFILAILTACVSVMEQDSDGKGTFLFCSLISVFMIGMMLYRAFKINKSFRVLKKNNWGDE